MGVRLRHRQQRYALVAAVALVALLGDVSAAPAQLASVPVSLQVQLLSRVVQYERSFVARASVGAVCWW